MKKRLVIAARAKGDLAAISKYTRKTWGERQRRAYMTDLKACLGALSLMSGLGRARDELKPGWRTLPCGSHVILYKDSPERIDILRIFHGSQDITAAGV